MCLLQNAFLAHPVIRTQDCITAENSLLVPIRVGSSAMENANKSDQSEHCLQGINIIYLCIQTSPTSQQFVIKGINGIVLAIFLGALSTCYWALWPRGFFCMSPLAYGWVQPKRKQEMRVKKESEVERVIPQAPCPVVLWRLAVSFITVSAPVRCPSHQPPWLWLRRWQSRSAQHEPL